MLFAGIDLLFCLIDFITPSSWNPQLECVELKSFKGPDVLADMMVFIFVPIAMERFASIMDATLNSRTGKRMFSGFTTGSFTTQGRTRNPDTGEPIDNKEPAGAGQRNPLFDFELADSFEHWLPTEGADNCATCFNCKARILRTHPPHGASHSPSLRCPSQWPELRLIWLVVAGTISLFSSQNYNTFAGNVAHDCGSNGSFYLQACGPVGAEQLFFNKWKTQYTAGFEQIDGRIFDDAAADVLEKHEDAGAQRTPEFAQLVRAAQQWSENADASEQDKAAVFVYHSCRVMRAEAAVRGLSYDTPEMYHALAHNSIERIASQFLFGICRRFKYEVGMCVEPHLRTPQ